MGWKEAHNASHRHVRVEHTFAKLKVWKALRDRRLHSEDPAQATAGIARLCNLNLAG